ncbi:MAG: DUF2442 domain-containing protein [Planctomycetes bacterium]|nr:DUF2442 domain-containing protein [Planctomycetota bacterium]
MATLEQCRVGVCIDCTSGRYYPKGMEISEAKALPGYRLELRFDNGESGMVDLSEFVGRSVFAAWEKPGEFEQVTVTADGAVEWPGEIDLCPDALYLRMTGKKPEDLFPSLRNRLSHA